MTEPRRLTPGERLALIALGMIAAQLIFRGWAVSGSWFYSDDFIFLGRSGQGRADLEWFFTPHNIHLMPLGLWLATWVGSIGAFSWWLAVVQILFLQAIASLACWWMLRTVFGDRTGVLVALGFYLVTPMAFPTVLWWAASLNQLPHQIAVFGAVAAHVTFLRNRRWTPALVAGLFLLLGYATYTKTILLPVLLVLVTVTYFASGNVRTRITTSLVRYRRAWLVQGILTAGYLTMYFIKVPSSERPTLRTVSETLDLSIVKSYGPALLGGPWRWDELTLIGDGGPRTFVATPLTLIALSWMVLGLLLAYQCLRYRRAWWPLVVLGPYVVLSGLIVSAGRADIFGVTPSATELRYLTDLAGVSALALGLATMPVIGAAASLEPRKKSLIGVTVPRRALKIGAGAIVAGALFSSVTYALPWHDDDRMQQKTFISNARDSLESTPSLADTTVPDGVLWAPAFPANLVSYILSPLGDKLHVLDLGNDLAILDGEGKTQFAVVDGDGRNLPGPVDGCGYSVTDQSTTIGVVPVINFSFWMSINYVATADGVVTVTTGDTSTDAPVAAGPHTLFLRTFTDYDEVTFSIGDGVRLCVDTIKVGALIPLDES